VAYDDGRERERLIENRKNGAPSFLEKRNKKAVTPTMVILFLNLSSIREPLFIFNKFFRLCKF
jgi:hypothetical protein